MIPAGLLASTPVDFRKGATGLMALMRDGGADPFSGALYVFRSKRADRIKAVWFDGTGVCLFAKTLEEAQFCWPRIGPATVQLNHTQLLALVEPTGRDFESCRLLVCIDVGSLREQRHDHNLDIKEE
jgi:transposase